MKLLQLYAESVSVGSIGTVGERQWDREEWYTSLSMERRQLQSKPQVLVQRRLNRLIKSPGELSREAQA